MRRRRLLSGLPLVALMTNPRRGSAAAPIQPITIGIMGGEIDGTFMRIATDLTSVLNSDSLRVVPIVGKGSLQNLGDLLHLPGVDLALVAADVLAYAHAANLYPGELAKVQYICKLYENDVHVCARPEIHTLAELQGKPVNIDVEGAGTNLTARAIFKMLDIAADFRTDEPTIGQDKLRRGEIAANVYVAGKPVRLFAVEPAQTDLHFLEVPSTEAVEKTYLPGGQFTHTDYPNLVGADQTVETVGIAATLAVFNWPAGSTRYRNLVTFVDSFFTRFPELLKPPHHPKWHDVNLAAAQPGWIRFAPAAAWLARYTSTVASNEPPAEARAKFDLFLTQRGIPSPHFSYWRVAWWLTFRLQTEFRYVLALQRRKRRMPAMLRQHRQFGGAVGALCRRCGVWFVSGDGAA